MEGNERPKRFYRTGEVAFELGVAERTVAAWIQQGKVAVVRTIGGHARIEAAELNRLREAMGNAK